MDDRGFFLTGQAISKQLAAMPSELYLVRNDKSSSAQQLSADAACLILIDTVSQNGPQSTIRGR